MEAESQSTHQGPNSACDHCSKGSGVFVCSQFEQRRRTHSDPRPTARATRLYSISSVFEEDRWVVQTQVENKKRERYKQMCRMLALMLVPVVSLLAVTAILLSNVITKQNNTDAARVHVHCFLSVNSLVNLLYNETDVTLSVMLSKSNDANYIQSVLLARNSTDVFVRNTFLPVCSDKTATQNEHNPSSVLQYINDIRMNVDSHVLNEYSMTKKYHEVVGILQNRTRALHRFPGDHANILNELFSINALCHTVSALRIQKNAVHMTLRSCQLTNAVYNDITRRDGVIDTYLIEGGADQLAQHLSDSNSTQNVPTTAEILDRTVSNNTCPNRTYEAQKFANDMFDFKLNWVTQFTTKLSDELQANLDNLSGHTKKEIIIYSIVAAFISVVCIWASLWYASCIQTLTHVLSLYALKSAEKSKELAQEKKKTESLLYQMMPPTIANQLRDNKEVKAQYYESVTICFSDIVGFTSLSSISTPYQIVNLLNDLYSMFDSAIDQFDVYKVETIGDAYMVVSGLPEKNDNHTTEIAEMALDIRREVQDFKIPHLPDTKLLIRIGFHTGPCMAGVVGTKMPRYCLFGDAVNVASRMESTSESQKIQISEETRDILVKNRTFVLEKRGDVDVKGKGVMTTYWLVSRARPSSKRKTSFLIPSPEHKEQEPLINCNGHYGQPKAPESATSNSTNVRESGSIKKTNIPETESHNQTNMLECGANNKPTILEPVLCNQIKIMESGLCSQMHMPKAATNKQDKMLDPGWLSVDTIL